MTQSTETADDSKNNEVKELIENGHIGDIEKYFESKQFTAEQIEQMFIANYQILRSGNDRIGTTLLHIACDKSDKEGRILVFLLAQLQKKLSADKLLEILLQKDFFGHNIFMANIRNVRTDLSLYNILLTSGLNQSLLRKTLFDKDCRGNSIFHMLPDYCDESSLRDLLSQINVFIDKNDTEFVELLITKNQNGKTPLDLFFSANIFSLANYLYFYVFDCDYIVMRNISSSMIWIDIIKKIGKSHEIILPFLRHLKYLLAQVNYGPVLRKGLTFTVLELLMNVDFTPAVITENLFCDMFCEALKLYPRPWSEHYDMKPDCAGGYIWRECTFEALLNSKFSDRILSEDLKNGRLGLIAFLDDQVSSLNNPEIQAVWLAKKMDLTVTHPTTFRCREVTARQSIYEEEEKSIGEELKELLAEKEMIEAKK